MNEIWDDARKMAMSSLGSPVRLGFVTSRTQAERWQASGYDIPSLVDRHQAMKVSLSSMPTEREKSQSVLDFFVAETGRALSAGITDTDPDLWRLKAAPKHYEIAPMLRTSQNP